MEKISPTLSLQQAPVLGVHAAPVQNLGPLSRRSACVFIRARCSREAYRQQIFIAEHGSWNRTTPSGYRVILVRDNDRAVSYEPFAEDGCTMAVLGDDLLMYW
jgi:glucose/arabinose dehydrogenase